MKKIDSKNFKCKIWVTNYEIEDARYVASNPVLFTFSPITIKGISGYSIAINPYFRHSIAGKMTLPNKYNNSNSYRYWLEATRCKLQNIASKGIF